MDGYKIPIQMIYIKIKMEICEVRLSKVASAGDVLPNCMAQIMATTLPCSQDWLIVRASLYSPKADTEPTYVHKQQVTQINTYRIHM